MAKIGGRDVCRSLPKLVRHAIFTLIIIMPEVYNPNPTIYTPERPSKRKTEKEIFWIDEEDDEPVDENAVEPIDRDEIFGALQTNISTILF